MIGWIAVAVVWFHPPTDDPPPADSDPIARATASVQAAVERAEADPARPVAHFRPPAQWMNDPNGPFKIDGTYHLFYQHNPYGDRWDHMHWGHARSKDLIHWEHLPIALAPVKEKGEAHCFSGCAARDGEGRPVLLYTSIGHPVPECWAALPEDDKLLKWKRHPGNPVLTAKSGEHPEFFDWRDPFVFRFQGKTYLIHGGNLNAAKGGQAIVALYRADDTSLLKWSYVGIFFRHPDASAVNIECPNLYPVGDKWALIVSPHRAVEAFVGTIDPESMTFRTEQRGLIDVSDQFYAPNGLIDDGGRVVFWGWIRGFPEGKGWSGCLSHPRVLALDASGRLTQKPALEVERLRDVRLPMAETGSPSSSTLLPTIPEVADLEWTCRFQDASELIISAGTEELVRVTPGNDRTARVRILRDRSVWEVFVDDGRICATRMLPKAAGPVEVTVRAERGSARFGPFLLYRGKAAW
jgi:beta-fructofuranosidase